MRTLETNNYNTKIRHLVVGGLLVALSLAVFAQNKQLKLDDLRVSLEDAPKAEKVEILNLLAEKQLNTSNQEALRYASQALHLARELKDRPGEVRALISLGIANGIMLNRESAELYLSQAQKIAEEIGDKKLLVKSLVSIGKYNEQVGNHRKALDCYLEARTIIDKTDLPKERLIILQSIGCAYAGMGKYQEAMDYLGQALSEANRVGNLSVSTSAMNRTGEIYLKIKNYREAKNQLKKALKIAEQAKLKRQMIIALSLLGECSEAEKDYREATANYVLALRTAEEIDDKEQMMLCYKSLYEIYQNTGNYRQAYEYLKKFSDLSAQVFTSKYSSQKSLMNAFFEIEKQNLENESLRNENQLKQAEIMRQRYLRNFSIFISLLILLFLVVMYNRYSVTKRAENQVDNEKRFLQTMIDTIPSAVFFKNFSNRLIGGNKAFMAMLPLPKNEILGKPIEDLFPESVANTIKKSDNELLSGSKSQLAYETTITYPDKSVHDVIINKARFFRVGKSSPQGVLGIILDITDRKRMEEEIKESEGRLRDLGDTIPGGVIFQVLRDSFGNYRLTHISAGITKLTGVSQARALREIEAVGDLIVDEDRAKLYKAHEISAGTLKVVDSVFQYKSAEDELRWCRIRSVPRRENPDHTIWNGFLLDVTAEKQAEELREDIERITRHDLKTPLNGIISIPSRLLADDNLTEVQRDLLNILMEAGYQMLNMINLSLSMYRMEKGTYELESTTVNLLPVIFSIIEELKQKIATRGIEMKLSIGDKPAEKSDSFIIYGDELLCFSMLANLIKNAIEATPRMGVISISMREEKHKYEVRINNPGVVSESIRAKFFDKYVTAGKNHGTGLGTYSAKLIAETHGGAIYMETSEQDGTTITIQLPKLD